MILKLKKMLNDKNKINENQNILVTLQIHSVKR
jgi:hypothetical protein